MVRRTLGVLLALGIGLHASSAMAAPAALAPDEEWLIRMGAARQQETQRWALVCPETQAVFDHIASGGLRTPNRTQAYFFLALEIDAATSLVQPVLTFYVFGSKPLAARAVSFGIDQTRYDLPVVTESLSMGGTAGEKLRAALDAEGMAMLARLSQAGDIVIRFYGSKTTDLRISPAEQGNRAGNGQSDWNGMYRASLEGIRSMLALVKAGGMVEYALWPLNQNEWQRAYGYLPQVDAVTAPTGGEAMEMCRPEDKGEDVKRLQELLAQKNLYYGPVNGTYNALTQLAVLRVQEQAGLVPTGCADGQVWRFLQNGSIPTASPAVEEEAPIASADGGAELGRNYALGEALTLSLERYWYARTVFPSRGDDPVFGITVQNTDHLLLALEGRMQNLGAEALDLYWQVPAEIIVDGIYSYPCSIHRERDRGTRFDTQLLPLDDSKVVICAEVPRAVMESGAGLRLEITSDTTTLAFPLR